MKKQKYAVPNGIVPMIGLRLGRRQSQSHANMKRTSIHDPMCGRSGTPSKPEHADRDQETGRHHWRQSRLGWRFLSFAVVVVVLLDIPRAIELCIAKQRHRQKEERCHSESWRQRTETPTQPMKAPIKIPRKASPPDPGEKPRRVWNT